MIVRGNRRRGGNPGVWRIARKPSLAQFVLLSLLLHAFLVLLFGAPAGGSRDGRAIWGPLNVVIQPGMRDIDAGLAAPSPSALELPGAELVRRLEAGRKEGSRPAEAPKPAPSPVPATAREPIPAARTPSLLPPDMERGRDSDRPASEQRPAVAPVVPETADLRPEPLPLPVVAEPPRVEPAPSPLPAMAPVDPIVLPRFQEQRVLPLPMPPIPAAPTPVVPMPAKAAPDPLPAAVGPAPAPAPAVPSPLQERAAPPAATSAPPVPARESPAEPRAAPPAVRETLPAERGETRAPPVAPATVPAARAPGEGRPDRQSDVFRRGAEPATPAPDSGSAPRIDLDAARRRAREMAREGSGNRAPLPFPMPAPPEPKSKEALALEKALKPLCKDAYKGLGLLAVVPLVANEFGEGNCRW